MAVVREMELRRATFTDTVIAPTLYIGGGTPSILYPPLVARLVEAAARHYGLTADAEITLEANPGTVTRDKLVGYRSAGVNRLSLGVQSFHDPLLARLGRIHTAGEAVAAFAVARDAGFANIGIDLIHSLPGENLALWQADLSRAVALAPEHISAYGLTIEAGTPFHVLERGGELVLPEEEEAAGMFEQTAEVFRRAGYEHYEISNFARTGRRSRHNQVYWRRESYLGFGAGAHSFLATPSFGSRWHNPEQPELYLQAIGSGLLPQEELSAMTEREAMAETLFLGLRMLEGVDGERFRQVFGVTLEEAYSAELHRLLTDALLEWREGRLRLTRRGLLMANQVFVRFL